jgi:hypothetical protein
MLSDTKNLLYLQRKDTQFNSEQEGYFTQYKSKDKWSPEMENRKFSPCFISGDTFTINTLPFHKHVNRFSNLS